MRREYLPMIELSNLAEHGLYRICANWRSTRMVTEDNYSFHGGLMIDTGESSETVTLVINELLEGQFIQLDEDWLTCTGMTRYFPTKKGIEEYKEMTEDDEPVYSCLCRGTNACIQCNPKMFI